MRKQKRADFLIDTIRFSGFTSGAEIGVYRGQTARNVLRACPNLKLILVDLWDFRPDVYGERELSVRKGEDQRLVFKRFLTNIAPFRKRARIIRGISWEMADKIEDESLDFIFVDADHAYESVKKDLQAWVPKVKPDGMIMGHDINLPDVLKAVKEMFGGYFWYAQIDNVWFVYKEEVSK